MAPEDIDKTVAVVIDLIKIGSMAYPPLAVATPILTSFIQNEARKLHVGLANGSIMSDNQGGFISKEWAADPRHALNPDGTFKY